MGAIDTNYTFTATDVITSTKMNNILDQSTVTASAIFNNTLDISSGKLLVKAGGITSTEMGENSVRTIAIAAGAVTSAKLDPLAQTETIKDGVVSASKLNGGQSGLSPIFAPRAWFKILSADKGFAGGFSTVVNVTSGYPTVTTQLPHGLITGNYVFPASGAAAGLWPITKTSENTFTLNYESAPFPVTTITFKFKDFLGGNVTSVAATTTTKECYLNTNGTTSNAVVIAQSPVSSITLNTNAVNNSFYVATPTSGSNLVGTGGILIE